MTLCRFAAAVVAVVADDIDSAVSVVSAVFASVSVVSVVSVVSASDLQDLQVWKTFVLFIIHNQYNNNKKFLSCFQSYFQHQNSLSEKTLRASDPMATPHRPRHTDLPAIPSNIPFYHAV